MKIKTYTLVLLVITVFQWCNAQQSQTILPKIENYTKGELELKTLAFGDENPMTIGKIMADGTIHFNFVKTDVSNTNENDYWTKSIKNFSGGKFCRDPKAIITNKKATLVENKYIYIYKYDQPVGYIIPSTQKIQEHNKSQLGSTIDWIYSDAETTVKANCSENKVWKDLYSFKETTAYNLDFKKGWNIVTYSLEAIEEWEENGQKRSLPKTKIVKSITKIPANINWYLKYTADDESLEIEQQLIKLKPITKQAYESWLPKKLGKLKRTSYEIGKTIERMATTNNVNLQFEKGSKTIDLTIVDCVGSKDAASMFTMMKDMASRDWKDKTKTGYRSASKIDDNRVMIDFNEKEINTMITYNSNNRFMIKAEADNIKPEALWETLKSLELEKLVKK